MKINFKRQAEEQNWQVSYIDLLTAMLAAFTMLLSISVPDQAKLDNLASSVSDSKKTQQNLATLAKQLNETVKNNKALKDHVKVVMTDQGIELHFGVKLLFPLGKAKLLQEGYDAINSIGGDLKSFVNARDAYIAVEGHTDDQVLLPGSGFRSNWELSTARAGEVVHFLTDTVKIESRRLSATGYGDSRPLNKERDSSGVFTERARAENRRVVLRIYYYREPDVFRSDRLRNGNGGSGAKN